MNRKDIEKTKKEIYNDLKKRIKSSIKETNFKFRDYLIYFVEDDYIYYSMLYITVKEKGYEILTTVDAKPFEIDNIFWEIFNMPENKDEPASLRAIGAFTILPLEIGEFKLFCDDISADYSVEMLEGIKDIIIKFNTRYENDNDAFYKLVDNENYIDRDLVKMLYLIKQEKYQEALDIVTVLLDNYEYGKFRDDKKSINEYIRDYCLKKLGRKIPRKSIIKKIFGGR
ncbi:hypothetical protein LJB88_00045 [Erysipelotrichaceae bacterium OttesenSCG-928-M19]|nr:hypothetical protein [Erysipelotrichaceae bacterium OttesenSCG-928-M19]